MSDEAHDDWTPFLRDLDGQPATVNLNHHWMEDGPESGRRTLVHVAIRMQTAQGRGMPSEDEFERLAEMEEQLAGALEASGDAVFVATMMMGDERTAYFFSKKAGATVAAAEKVIAGWKGHKATCGTTEDADGEVFIENVCPTAAEIRWNGDISVIEQLRENGDDPTRAREIQHFAYFEDSEAAEEFVEWCNDNEFEGASTEEGEDGEYLVSFTHVGRPEIDEIFDRTAAADEAASELGGMYDGWETEIVRK